ncbi:MAG: energy transducer TonB [Crocinitomicaceae bacterium]|nr:energy transducer TonB [Crocinitomicaceae bacterium]
MLSGVKAQGEEFPLPTTETEFPGGASELKKFIKTNLRYPESAILNKDKGRVYVSFIVEADGSLSDVHLINSITQDLDAEGLRIFALMPKWTPGKLEGENIRVKCRMPINFEMDAKSFRKAKRRIRKESK